MQFEAFVSVSPPIDRSRNRDLDLDHTLVPELDDGFDSAAAYTRTQAFHEAKGTRGFGRGSGQRVETAGALGDRKEKLGGFSGFIQAEGKGIERRLYHAFYFGATEIEFGQDAVDLSPIQ